MVVENIGMSRQRRREDVNPEKGRAPFIRPCDEIWDFCKEMGEKYGITPRDAYSILEMKIVHIAKLHEEKNAQVTVSAGKTIVEVSFFRKMDKPSEDKTP